MLTCFTPVYKAGVKQLYRCGMEPNDVKKSYIVDVTDGTFPVQSIDQVMRLGSKFNGIAQKPAGGPLVFEFEAQEDADKFTEALRMSNKTEQKIFQLSQTGNTFPIIEEKMKDFGGWWSDRINGVMIFPTEWAHEQFQNWMDATEGKAPGPKMDRRAPTNLQALDMIENAVRSAKHAKRAKTYLSSDRAKMIEHASIKITWGGDEEHVAAMFYINQAFMEYMPAILDVARKKAEETDRAARDQLRHWGEQS